jgi:hypothetical protein
MNNTKIGMKEFLKLYTRDYLTNNLLLNLVDAISRTQAEFNDQFNIKKNHGIDSAVNNQKTD